MSAVAKEIFASGYTFAIDGARLPTSSHISLEEGSALHDLIRTNPSVTRTLEIGCAQGVSSLFICEALQDRPTALHNIIDPFQYRNWKGAGIAALQRANLHNFRLIEERSEFALPELLKQGSVFDLVFIDGWHTLDHTLLDAFYAVRLLRIGGFLVIDDTEMPPIMKAVAYLRNYPCLRIHKQIYTWPEHDLTRFLCAVGSMIPVTPNMRFRAHKKLQKLLRAPSMIILAKESEDQRKWNWYRPF